MSEKIPVSIYQFLIGVISSIEFDPSKSQNINLPSNVLLPQAVTAVAGAMNFAKEHMVEVSIKNSGHSYTGASTKKDTRHINMRMYKQYSSDGIVD